MYFHRLFINEYIFIFRSFFQSVCVLGYCLLPIVIALIVCRFILIFEQTNFLFFIRFAISIGSFLWATYGKLLFKSLLTTTNFSKGFNF
jgi:hypothetical protein